MIFPIATIHQGEVLQVSIIVQNQIIEDNYAEELQDFNGSRLGVTANDFSTFFITQIAVLVVAAAIGFRQSPQRSKVFLLVFTAIESYIETTGQICRLAITEKT